VKKTISLIVITSLLLSLFSCSSSKFVDLDAPKSGESVKINLIDGSSRQGVLLKRSGEVLTYMDSETAQPEDLQVSGINTIERLNVVLDLAGQQISEQNISNVQGSGKMWGYGAAGALAGALIGFGAGALYSSVSDQSVALIYPMIGFGIAGAVFLGMKGSQSDRMDAIEVIRKERYIKTQKELEDKIKQQEQELQKEKQQLKDLKGTKKSGN
jgi:hypothetical protein